MVFFFTFLITGLCSCASLLRSDLSLFDDGEEEALEERKASEKKAKAFSLFSEKNASAQENNLIKQSEVFPFDENHLEPRLTRRVTKEDFIDQSQEEGSLWASSGQTNYYFTKNKIRSPGEMISLNVETDLFLDIKNEIKRSLSSVENAKEIQDLKNHYRFEMNKKRAQFFETQTGGSSTQTQNKEAPPNSKKDVAKDSTEESLLQKPLSQFSINDVDIEPSLF